MDFAMVFGLLVLAALVTFVAVAGVLVDWSTFNKGACVRLRLCEFRNLIRINPDKWKFYDTFITYCGESGKFDVGLSLPAYVWFLVYRRTATRRRKQSDERKYKIMLLEDCQKDINRLRAEAERQIQDGLRQQAEVLSKMKEEK